MLLESANLTIHASLNTWIYFVQFIQVVVLLYFVPASLKIYMEGRKLT